MIELEQGWSVVPVDRVGGVLPPVLGFEELRQPVVDLAIQASYSGSVLYLHQEFHGGTGFDAAVVWRDGEVVFGPRFTASHEAERQSDRYEVVQGIGASAINEALRSVGVQVGDRRDEFEAVGLTKHRWNDEWRAEDA